LFGFVIGASPVIRYTRVRMVVERQDYASTIADIKEACEKGFQRREAETIAGGHNLRLHA